MDRVEEGRKIFDIEIEALQRVRDGLGETFLSIVEMIIRCGGKVVVTGIGKPGHIAKKIAATFSSLGIPSFYLHPAEALHGDLGMVSKGDMVIIISHSGESEEITRILTGLRMVGVMIVAITSNGSSSLAQCSDIVEVFPQLKEACHLGLAPTSSTTAALCYGDALAVVASKAHGFKKEDFGKLHPAGALGRKILVKVEDIMASGKDNAVICAGCSLKEAIVELSQKGLGIVNIVNEKEELLGVITDGDLRRLLESEVDVYQLRVDEVMTTNPIFILQGSMAIEALYLIKEKNISSMPVIYEGIVVGTIQLQTIVKAGII